MRATSREQEATKALADALLEFMLAREEAVAARERERPRENTRAHVDVPRPAIKEPRPATIQAEPKLPEKLLVDSKEAAELLSVGGRTLWTMTAPRGPIPSVRVGRAVRYSVSSLEEFVRRVEVKPRRAVSRHP